ncbi:exodeoxyribonuclease VII large subunit [Psychrobium sp. MM17-31]|uniref:exodeoxyribonuclease VII large subunit n=1 Tax=Psychrobium sp. MM17-31 TaxID=2917758 RepID=UPI001EF4B216|nr:exodeoxyribonuclease VII large subunit [Psychrobium sp. MM17-31]MCG7531868.1 exodeoxyribonuclease VII large subunit [Psychrobium sp. MM17-31]
MYNTPSDNIYNISRLNSEIKRLLEGNFGRVWVNAEISNFVAASSGHWYFTLKDARSQIKCAMFKGRNRAVRFRPQNGQQVMVKANISVYEPRGDYQLLVDVMDQAGDGLLQQQFEQLKCDLAAQGLFSSEHKKPLPESIQKIGIITSPTGAAVHDVLTVLKRRNPLLEVVIYPAQVQGQQAAGELCQAINLANLRNEVDVLLLTRGGGSMEDLWCFNDPQLAYAIFNSQLPIISAVGHEVDVTISDFVSDFRAPTPSAAAEIASVSNEEQRQKNAMLTQRLSHAMSAKLHQYYQVLTELSSRLKAQDPKFKLAQQAQYIDELNHQMTSAIRQRLHHNEQRLSHLFQRLLCQSPAYKIKEHNNYNQQLTARLKQAMNQQLASQQARYEGLIRELNSVSPLATLARGYSIALDESENVITDASQVNVGDALVTKLHYGELVSTVSEKR